MSTRNPTTRPATGRGVPPLESGDRLTRAEFERRYEAMPDVKKAELIEGEVYMPSPVSLDYHAEPHSDVVTWLGVYKASTAGVGSGDNATVRLAPDNEPQPDALLYVRPEFGGRVRVTKKKRYLRRAPEFVFEVAASSTSIDLGKKLTAYRRNKVSEYAVWRVYDDVIDWFVYRAGGFDPLAPDPADGLFKSTVFPGLWLDPTALMRGDLPAVLATLSRGLASPEHAAFVQLLASRRTTP